ncbi:helix-turn-helix domain-containing protein [Amycolatopsis nigrescens]|uniref:helix-turn-helix domain-containing protein n=1 Tax=Amycolatopsis nigrescens TaxID=381445 RepID=UPI0007C56D38|nr:helix-turn-helix transcriptional regulator [Amycolatopsis nigrescens]
MAATPTRAKKRLGAYLRGLRERAGLILRDATKELRLSADAVVSRYESGHNRPPWSSVAALLTLYDATAEERTKAVALWEEAGVATPQVRLPAGAPKTFRELVRAEQEASRARIVAPVVVPGLLQTANYAREVHASAQQSLDQAANVDAFVAARLERQKLLEDGSFRLHAVLAEATLRQLVGGAEVMREQLEHLLTIGKKANVTIQAVPFSAGAYGGMSGGCTILDYDGDDPSTAYLEYPAGGAWVDNEGDVQHLSAMFTSVSKNKALPPAGTVELIRRVVREL